jgi:MYXO-CTERM domain-containing protein
VDTHNPAGFNTPMGGITSIRSPITMDGGSLASTGFSIDLAATNTDTGAVFSGTPVEAKISNDFTVAAGKTSTVLLYDPLDPTAPPIQNPRYVHIMTDPAATGLSGDLNWQGTLEIVAGASTGGALRISRDVAATGGTVNVAPGATIRIRPGATLELSGPGNTLLDSVDGDRVDIINESSAPGTGLRITDGNHTVGDIFGPGRTHVAGGFLRGRTLDQDILEIGAGAKFQLSAAEEERIASRIRSLSILGGISNDWLGELDVANRDVIIEQGDLDETLSQIKQGRGDGSWTGPGGITSSAAALDAANGLPITGVVAIRNTDDGVTPIFTTFGNVPVGVNAILMGYTYNADTDLNRILDADDTTRFDRGFLLQQDDNPANDRTGPRNGDFDGNGRINAFDAFLHDQAFGIRAGIRLSPGSPAPLSDGASAVPEPVALPLLAVGALGLLRRRRGARS